MKTDYVVVFDIETSGTNPSAHEITQLAAVVANFSDLAPVAEFNRRLRIDESKADLKALEINHYDRALWESTARPPKDVFQEFSEFLMPYRYPFISKSGNLVRTTFPVGHNISRFDHAFIQQKYTAMGLWCPLGFIMLDTLQMAVALEFANPKIDFPDRTLSGVARGLGLSVPEGLHDALEDVKLNLAVLGSLRAELRLLGKPAFL